MKKWFEFLWKAEASFSFRIFSLLFLILFFLLLVSCQLPLILLLLFILFFTSFSFLISLSLSSNMASLILYQFQVFAAISEVYFQLLCLLSICWNLFMIVSSSGSLGLHHQIIKNFVVNMKEWIDDIWTTDYY